MKSSRAIFCLWFCLLPAMGFTTTLTASVSPAEYRLQLQDLNARVEQIKEHPEQAKQLEADLPDRVFVTDNSHQYSLSYLWLKDLLKQFRQADLKTRNSFLQTIQKRLQILDQEAEQYEKTSADLSSARKKMDEILSRREFKRAHGPTMLDIWWEKAMRWIAKFFEKHPVYGRSSEDLLHLLIYAVVAVALSVFAIWIKRRLDRPKEEVQREIVPFAPSAKGWRKWLADAQAATLGGDWRNGVHLAYWAGISFLEEHGAWRPDRARTPREYLRILGTRKPQYPALAALTRKFEVIWYGHRDATANDFQEILQQLERIGCK
jgi:Domain of unknown function (DUF4129)